MAGVNDHEKIKEEQETEIDGIFLQKPGEAGDYPDDSDSQDNCSYAVVTFGSKGYSKELEDIPTGIEVSLKLEELNDKTIHPCVRKPGRLLLRWPLMKMYKQPFLNWPRIFVSMHMERICKLLRPKGLHLYDPEHREIVAGKFLKSGVMADLKKYSTPYVAQFSGTISKMVISDQVDPNGQLMKHEQDE